MVFRSTTCHIETSYHHIIQNTNLTHQNVDFCFYFYFIFQSEFVSCSFHYCYYKIIQVVYEIITIDARSSFQFLIYLYASYVTTIYICTIAYLFIHFHFSGAIIIVLLTLLIALASSKPHYFQWQFARERKLIIKSRTHSIYTDMFVCFILVLLLFVPMVLQIPVAT